MDGSRRRPLTPAAAAQTAFHMEWNRGAAAQSAQLGTPGYSGESRRNLSRRILTWAAQRK